MYFYCEAKPGQGQPGVGDWTGTSAGTFAGAKQAATRAAMLVTTTLWIATGPALRGNPRPIAFNRYDEAKGKRGGWQEAPRDPDSAT